MAIKYVAPEFERDGFNCPHCDAYSHQVWCPTNYVLGHTYHEFERMALSYCAKCKELSIWFDKRMLYPTDSSAPLPSEDMPSDVQEDFSEARDIVNRSPRAAGALLRLSLQKLMTHLGQKGKNINEDIGKLVKQGLPDKISKSLDAVRVIGNNAVHPGVLDLKDDIETALRLFELVNMITEVVITQKKKVDELFDKLPEGAKKAIEERDN